MDDKVYTHIFYDIYNKILQLSENPSQFAEYLTLQIRELIGTRTVVVAIKTEIGQTKIFSVYPQRRNDWASQSAVIKLAEHSFHNNTVQYLDREKCDNDCSGLLTHLEIEKIIAIPLKVGNTIIGSILLLDIMDDFGIESVINLLKELSGVFALVIRNAYLYHEMENLVTIRTAELQDQNRKLLQSEQELQALNEEYQVINEELTETLETSDRINKELVEANLRVEKSELQAREILQTAMDGFWLIDFDGRFLDVNEIACKMLGYKREELLAMSISDIEFEEKEEEVIQRIEKIKKEGKDRFETKHRCKNENIIDVEVSVVLLSSQNLLVVFIHDITEQKRAVTAIQESEERYRNVIDVSPDAIIVHSEGKIVLTNKAAVEAVGASGPHDLLGKSALEFVHPADREMAISRIVDLLHNGKPAPLFEERMVKMDGSIIDVEVAAVRTNFNGKPASLVVIRDITEHKQIQQKIKDSEKRFRAIFNQSPIAIALIDLQGHPIVSNLRLSNMLGYTKDELSKMTFTEFTYPEDIDKDLNQFNDLIAGKITGYNIEKRYIHKNGNLIWANLYVTTLYDNNGLPQEIIGMVEDITERKIAEKELIRKERDLKKAQQIAHLGSWYLDIATNHVMWTEELYKMYGFDPTQPVPPYTEHMKLFTPESWEILSTSLAETRETGIPYELELKTIKKDGTNGWMWVRGEAVKDKNETITGLWGAAQDITQYKQTEEELLKAKEKAEESEEKYKLLYENAGVGIGYYNPEGKVISFNQLAAKFMNGNPEDFIGKSIFDLSSKSEADLYLNRIQKAIIATEPAVYEDFVQLPTDEKWFLSAFTKIVNSQNKVFGVQIISQDITKLKTTEIELQKAKEKAEESDRLKSAFLANMSHEIRTPMNGILGFTELLHEPDLSSEQKEAYIDIVNQSGQRMLNTVNDIIEISKIEAGIVTVNLKEVDVQVRLDELMQFFNPEATKKGLKLILENEVPKAVALISTDQIKIDSILTNLIKNAIKFTQAGEIRVGCKVHENRLEFYVKDTGIGIPAERQQAVFERFIKADILDKDARQGSGLGLSITKAYVEMLGGEIHVESINNQGSTFFFTLPLNEHVQDETGDLNQEEKTSQIKGLNIVIAEDDETSSLYLQTILQTEGSKIILTKKGNETVESCRNNPCIDLVLMDIQMPDMNGYEATRRIREFNKDVVIIAQTAFALSGDREKAINAGCNDYITKPLKKEELRKLINRYFGYQGLLKS